jgi:hypothetical protein
MVPSFLIVHSKGFKEYKGKMTPEEILKHVSKFIVDQSKIADETWLNDNEKAAILFTDKAKVPTMWSSISSFFSNQIKIGKSNSSKLLKKFGGDKFPAIVMKNSTTTLQYNGKSSFNSVRTAIRDFFAGEYEVPFLFHIDYFLPEEYEEQKKDFTGYAVMETSDELSEELRFAKEKHQGKKFKFFFGSENIPLKFIKPNQRWILHPIQHRAYQLKQDENFNDICNGILEGRIKWSITNSNEL